MIFAPKLFNKCVKADPPPQQETVRNLFLQNLICPNYTLCEMHSALKSGKKMVCDKMNSLQI